MKRFVAGMVMVTGVLWMSACTSADSPSEGGGASPAKRFGPTGPMHRGGMLDDEMDFGRTF